MMVAYSHDSKKNKHKNTTKTHQNQTNIKPNPKINSFWDVLTFILIISQKTWIENLEYLGEICFGSVFCQNIGEVMNVYVYLCLTVTRTEMCSSLAVCNLCSPHCLQKRKNPCPSLGEGSFVLESMNVDRWCRQFWVCIMTRRLV